MDWLAWSGLCQRLGIAHKLTTAYHPQASGLVEGFHRQMKEALRARMENGDWYGHHTDKKENQNFPIYKEIQNGAVAKSYITNGLLIYD